MPIECVPSNLGSDVRCAVCGQGFLVYTDRAAEQNRSRLHQLLQNIFRTHHLDAADASAHPPVGFHVALAPTDYLVALA